MFEDYQTWLNKVNLFNQVSGKELGYYNLQDYLYERNSLL